MAGTFVSPGVYTLELDFSDYAPALATSIFGVVGTASWGPLNDVTLITNENALINRFGRPLLNDIVTPPRALHPAVTAGIHYLRSGSQFLMTRIGDGTEDKADVSINDAGTPADFTSLADLAGGVDLSTNKFVSIAINNAGPVTIDLSVGAVVPAATTRAEILSNLQAALSSSVVTIVNATGVLSEEFLRLTTVAGGTTAEIEFQSPPGNAATSAEIDSGPEPFNMQFLATPQLSIDVDNGGIQNVTFAFNPAVVTGTNTETFNFSAGGEMLLFTVILPGQTVALPTQTVTFQTADFAVPAAGTAAEVAAVINSQAIGLSAADVAGVVVLTSDKKGTGASIASVSGSAATILGLPASASGSGDAADATAVTAVEVAAVLTTDITGATATSSSGVVTLTSNTTGTTSELDVSVGGGIFAVAVTNGLNLSPALDATFTVFGVAPVTTVNGTGPFVTVTVVAIYEGTRGNDITIGIEAGTVSGASNYIVNLDGFEVERFNNLLLTDLETTVSDFVVFADAITSSAQPAPGAFPLLGGLDGVTSLTASDYIGVTSPVKTGLQLYSNAETLDVNILAVPGVSDGAVILELDSICQGRGDCLFIADPPPGLDVEGVVDWHNGTGAYTGSHPAFNTSYGCTYWSWMTWLDNYNATNILEPPSGFLAAIMAYTDNTSEPWFAPAGITRARVVEALAVEASPDQGERDFMYSGGNAVNPIVLHRSFGIYVKGQRTLQRAPTALDRINVRRLLLVLRKVIATAIVRLEFEPNDRTTRQRFVNIVTPFMESVVVRRGVEDFRVIMDESTNTPDVINRNEMRGKILIKPVKSAEIIVVEFTLLATGASFAESLS
jgi:hypothetical protein